jgi:sugar-specific transcriptional regulator TrmB
MDINELTGEDMSALLERYKNIQDDLALLNFSEYESRAYVALVALGVSDAEALSMIAQIPRTSVYKVLDGLIQKGYVTMTKGRPREYMAEQPRMLKERLFSRLGETFDDLEMVYGLLRERGLPQVVYTISGKDKVLRKIGELLDMSKERFMISSSNVPVLRDALEKKVNSAIKRGVDISLVLPPGQKAIPGVKTMRRDGLIATDIVVDGKLALIAGSGLEACGYTDNEVLAQHLEGFLRMMMSG